MNTIEIPGFEILHPIGKGGMASVWKARQVSLDRIVAIKVLAAHLNSDPADVRRFQSEAQAEAKLKHPGIVQVYDASVGRDGCYLVMEFVDGYTVGDWLRRKDRLDEDDALLVITYVAEALEYAWDKAGMVHCDIKPDNVMIDADGTVKVTDLGLARTISAMGPDASDDEVMGTPAYMSPEQVRGVPDLDCRTDIYSLGAMFYQLLTGNMLFRGEAESRIMELQLTGTVPDTRAVNPNVSPAASALVARMLARDRDVRYADWPSLRRDIVRVKKGHFPARPLMEAGVSTVAYTPVKPPARRPPRPPASRMVLAAVLAGVLGVAVGTLVRERVWDAIVPPPPPPSPSAAPAAAASPMEPAPAEPVEAVLYEAARAWAAAHPDAVDEAARRFRAVIAETRGTRYALMAQADLQRLRGGRRRAADSVMAALQKQANPHIEARQWLEAAQVFKGYEGPLARETRTERAARVAELRERHRQFLERGRMIEEEVRQQVRHALDDTARALVAEGLAAGRQIVDAAIQGAAGADAQGRLQKVQGLLEAAADMDGRVLGSFDAQRGQEVTVQLAAGPRKVTIADVANGKVHAYVATGVRDATAEIWFGVADLATSERLARMGPDRDPDVALVKGLMALAANAPARARSYFQHTDPLLAGRLLREVDGGI